jgi:hypothetical protein
MRCILKRKSNKKIFKCEIVHTLRPSRKNGIRQQPTTQPKRQIPADESHTATPLFFSILVTMD